jgi:hypothetical protein
MTADDDAYWRGPLHALEGDDHWTAVEAFKEVHPGTEPTDAAIDAWLTVGGFRAWLGGARPSPVAADSLDDEVWPRA